MKMNKIHVPDNDLYVLCHSESQVRNEEVVHVN